MLLSNLMDLKDKVILITGGSGHLGAAMCEALAEFNATLYIGSRSFNKNLELSKNLTNKFNNLNYPIKLDVSNIISIERNIQEIMKEHHKIDVLINNAYYGAGKDLISMEYNDWYKGIDGTINSVYRTTKLVLPHMIKRKSGKIINVSSMYGIISPDVSIYTNTPFYNPANYGAGKAAIIQFTKFIAAVYGTYGINSNVISPGPFPNEQVQKNHEFISRLKNKVPLKRIGFPDDLKGIIVLLSSDASNFFNGTNIIIDGGWSIY
ncbi:MAG: SDR family oxidoreductase [Promethearchaeota archaeon]